MLAPPRSPLLPEVSSKDVSEHKYYAPGVGLVLGVDPKTGDREELVELRH
jgi:hypothetical protein